MLKDYAKILSEELLDGLPPMRGINNHMDFSMILCVIPIILTLNKDEISIIYTNSKGCQQ